MGESQFVLRMADDLLRELDRAIERAGFQTRSEWVRDRARRFVLEMESRRLLAEAATLGITESSEEETVAIVKAGRRERRERRGRA